MVNLLLVDVRENAISSAVVKELLKENQVDHLYMIVVKEEEWCNFKNLGECMLREKIKRGMYSEEELQMKDAIPLDDVILSYMESYVLQILHQQKRYEHYFDGLSLDGSFHTHYAVYMHNLFYWYNKLIRCGITHVCFPVIPHEGYESIIYYLCRYLNIPTLMSFSSLLLYRDYMMRDFMTEEKVMEKEYQRLRIEYQNVGTDEIELEGSAKRDFDNWSSRDNEKMTPYYMKGNQVKIALRNRYAETNLIMLWRAVLGRQFEKYGAGFRFLLASIGCIPDMMRQIPVSIRRWNYARPHKRKTYAMRKFYDEHARRPSEGERYIYFAMHYQPEATSNPIGGKMYYDQILPIHILCRSIPDDMKVYVRMHPVQIAFFCDIDYLMDLLKIPNIVLIDMQYSTFELMKNAVAVASISGTACWECQFFGVPAILFGHSYKNVSPMAYPVRTWEECRQAVADILAGKKKADLRDLKLFVKAAYHLSYPVSEKKEAYLHHIKQMIKNTEYNG